MTASSRTLYILNLQNNVYYYNSIHSSLSLFWSKGIFKKRCPIQTSLRLRNSHILNFSKRGRKLLFVCEFWYFGAIVTFSDYDTRESCRLFCRDPEDKTSAISNTSIYILLCHLESTFICIFKPHKILVNKAINLHSDK